jgi:hypothetical protein
MSTEIEFELEKHKKEFVMIQQQYQQMQQQIQQMQIARERKFGMIQLLEEQVKKKKALEAVEKESKEN